MSDPKKYTVGWICALSTEFTAAQAFLEETHEDPCVTAHHDTNSYALGKIGGHNVVMAVLPDGEYGIASAAAVARNMLHSFPNVRIGLMVGIGGGAPTLKNDVRLGDIVVSRRGDGRGGVFQYDFGKAVQNQHTSFEYTDFLDQPPTALRTAVSGLNSRYELNGNALGTKVEQALTRKPLLRNKYSRPSPTTDRLYLSSIIHPDSPGTCESLCGISPDHLVSREVRSHDEDNLVIHFGLIASANQLMKDSGVRDRLAMDNGVLCFEMEAAGLMNHFPCLVIRGICDYSDSHKSKEWQGFAAMAAAAYASDLLQKVNVGDVETSRRILEVLSEVKEGIQWIGLGVDEIKALLRTESEKLQRDRIHKWLLPPDPSTNLNQALKQRHKGTGGWLLLHDVSTGWKKGTRQHLWLQGMAGFGKTILSATMIDDLTETKGMEFQPILFFFFDSRDNDKKTFESLIRSLVWQLFDTGGERALHLDKLFDSSSSGSNQPDISRLLKCFVSMVRKIRRVDIVIDALDECTTTNELLPWIKGVSRGHDLDNIHFFLTGRPNADLLFCIPDLFGVDNCVDLKAEAVSNDIVSYLQARCDREFGSLDLCDALKKKIVTRVGDQAEGMFRWAACQMDALAKYRTHADIEDALEDLPKTLDETYHRILVNMSPDGTRLLQFLVYAQQPLTVSAASHIFKTRIKKTSWIFDTNDRSFDWKDLLRCCSSLISITTVSRFQTLSRVFQEVEEVQLAHFTVKEYLLEQSNFQRPAASIPLTQTCLTYIKQMCARPGRFKARVDFPLGQQAAQILTDLARFAETTENIVEGLNLLVRNRKTLGCLDDALFSSMGYSEVSPLYFACYAGLYNVAKRLLTGGADVNILGGPNGRPLCAAAAEGHADLVRLLLENGAEVNAENEFGETSLHYASMGGHKEVVRALLEAEAKVNSDTSMDGNALSQARYNGNVEVVRFLLDNGAKDLCGGQNNYWVVEDKDLSADENKRKAHDIFEMGLCAASRRGDKEEVSNILCWVGELGLKDSWHDFAVQVASEENHPEIVELLQGERLYQAAIENDYDIAEALLDEGADSYGSNVCDETALEVAATRGNLRFVELLLDNDTNSGQAYQINGNSVSVSGGYCWTAKQEVLDLLRQHQCQGSKSRRMGGQERISQEARDCALASASSRGHVEIVGLLLGHGADVNVRIGSGGNALCEASRNGHVGVVEYLLDRNRRDPTLEPQGRSWDDAIWAASVGGHDKVVQLLRDERLCLAASAGEYDMVEALLNEGANPNTSGRGQRNALQSAVDKEYVGIVKALLEKGADPDGRGRHYTSALESAVNKENLELVEMLLEKGAKVNTYMMTFYERQSWHQGQEILHLLREHV